MTTLDLTRARLFLEAEAARLADSLRRREAIAVSGEPDAVDAAIAGRDREHAIREIDRTSAKLRAVAAALERIAEGRYGICTSCEEEISPRRLAAIPHAALCVGCQEREEDEEQERRARGASRLSPPDRDDWQYAELAAGR